MELGDAPRSDGLEVYGTTRTWLRRVISFSTWPARSRRPGTLLYLRPLLALATLLILLGYGLFLLRKPRRTRPPP
jgi:hypothetical protein